MGGGELLFTFVNVMLMTVIIAALVLWRYRRAVLAGMQQSVGTPLPLPLPRPPAAPAPPAFTVDSALAWEGRLRRRIFAGTLAAAFVASLLLAVQYHAFEDLPFAPANLFLSAAVTSCVALPVYALLTATPLMRALWLGLLTLCGFGAATVVVSMLQRPFYGKAPSFDQLLNFVVFFQLAAAALWLPILLGAAIGIRRVRGVAPLAFATLLVFAIAPLLGVRLTQWLLGTRWSIDWVFSGPGIDAGIVVLALPVGLLSWWRLKSLARAYEAKRFSDAQLLAHSWWLLFVVGHAMTLVNAHPQTVSLLQIVGVSVVAYLIFPFLLGQMLRWSQRGSAPPAPRNLLLLRVFGDTRRTEALFKRIASRWQRFGPVTMIAAPDRDGRFRINEFCCRDDTWRATVVALIERADAVVMDLRGFTVQRRGCEFELKELGARVSPSKVVLVVDKSTDRALVAQLAPAGREAMRVIEVQRRSGAQTDAAFVALLGAAA